MPLPAPGPVHLPGDPTASPESRSGDMGDAMFLLAPGPAHPPEDPMDPRERSSWERHHRLQRGH